MSEHEWFTKDFYRELGVDKTADAATIKKAYRKLARKYHPDHNPGDAAAEAKFKEISEAYTVLSDASQRQKYDAIRQMAGGGARFAPGGAAGFEDLFGGMFGGGFSTGRGFSGGQRFEAGNVEDLLGGLFWGGFGGHSHGGPFGASGGGAHFAGQGGAFGSQGSPFGGMPTPERGADLKSAVTLSFRQALKGTEIRLKVSGRTVNARIPAGVKDGQKIKLAGKGKPGVNGGKPGDLVITVSVTPHPVIAREGNDLRMNVPVTLAEAATGCTLNVPLWDGSTITVKVPAGTTSGTTLRVKGQGVATSKATGDLLVDVAIAVPTSLSDEARSAVDAFAAATADFAPRATLAQQVGHA